MVIINTSVNIKQGHNPGDCRHALESHTKSLQSVQVMEKTMDITSHWTLESAEWVAAAEKTRIQSYQCSIDKLEGLVVSRMFDENEHVSHR